MNPLIFVVDGVAERRSMVQHTLEQAGYRVEVFATTRVLEIAEEARPSLMVVAIELPDGNGIALRDKIRQSPSLFSTAVIFLADSKRDKHRTILESDEDECLSFPWAPGELARAVETTFQRVEERSPYPSDAADIVIDSPGMRISVLGRQVTTTTLEFRLLEYMARHQGKAFSRDALLDAVWGDLQFVTPRSVDACIRRIRRKIEPESSSPRFLRTIRGIGYKLDAKTTWETAGGVCHCPLCITARARAKAAAPAPAIFQSKKSVGPWRSAL
jgi:DNA-binding response OmpR family regulator